MKIDSIELITVTNGWVLKLYCLEHNENEAFKLYCFEKENVCDLLEMVTDLVVEGEMNDSQARKPKDMG